MWFHGVNICELDCDTNCAYVTVRVAIVALLLNWRVVLFVSIDAVYFLLCDLVQSTLVQHWDKFMEPLVSECIKEFQVSSSFVFDFSRRLFNCHFFWISDVRQYLFLMACVQVITSSLVTSWSPHLFNGFEYGSDGAGRREGTIMKHYGRIFSQYLLLWDFRISAQSVIFRLSELRRIHYFEISPDW